MKISIITAVLNGAETIEDCLKSVASQTYPDIEYIIIDGGSTDGTLDIINKYKNNIFKVISEPDKGIYDAMNKGLSLASGDVIGFLNADDVYSDSSVLENVVRTMSDRSIDACYSDLVYVDRNDLSKIVRYWRSRSYQDGLFKKGWRPPHPTFYARKVVYEKHGKFDLNYCLAADFELMMRFLAQYKINSVYIQKVFVKMRMGGATNRSISNIIKQNIEIYRACRKNSVELSPFLFAVTQIMSRVKQFYSRPIS